MDLLNTDRINKIYSIDKDKKHRSYERRNMYFMNEVRIEFEKNFTFEYVKNFIEFISLNFCDKCVKYFIEKQKEYIISKYKSKYSDYNVYCRYLEDDYVKKFIESKNRNYRYCHFNCNKNLKKNKQKKSDDNAPKYKNVIIID